MADYSNIILPLQKDSNQDLIASFKIATHIFKISFLSQESTILPLASFQVRIVK